MLKTVKNVNNIMGVSFFYQKKKKEPGYHYSLFSIKKIEKEFKQTVLSFTR